MENEEKEMGNPQSRNEAILQATIDGTEYTDPPQSRIEDLLLQLKQAIEQGGGGGGNIDVTKTAISALGSAGTLPSWNVSDKKATFNAGAMPTASSVTVVTDVKSV